MLTLNFPQHSDTIPNLRVAVQSATIRTTMVLTFAKDTIFGEGLDIIIGAVIFVNCVCIGAELQHSIDGNDPVAFEVLEHVFLCVYIFEVAVRMYTLGVRRYFSSRWNMFDFVLVCIGVISEWICKPIMLSQGNSTKDTIHGRLVDQIMILRILRLLRLFRVFRLVHLFHDLWRLVNGVMQAAGAITSTFFLLVISVYVFACVGVEIITQNKTFLDDPELSLIVGDPSA